MRVPGAQRPTKIFISFKFLPSSECITKEKNTKSIISQKLRVGQKKSRELENHRLLQEICIFLVNLATFEKHFFCGSFVTFLAAMTRKLMIGKIGNIFFDSFQHISHLFCKDGRCWGEGGRGLHILSSETTNIYWSIGINYCPLPKALMLICRYPIFHIRVCL